MSLRELRREFELDDATLEDLIEELVDVQQVAERGEKVLSWRGAVEPAAPATGTEPEGPDTGVPGPRPA